MKYYIEIILVIILFIIFMLNEKDNFITFNSIIPSYDKEVYHFFDIDTYKFLVFDNNNLNQIGQFFQNINPSEFNIQSNNQYFPIKLNNQDLYFYFDPIKKLFYSKNNKCNKT